MNEDVFPIQDGDFPASYVCLPEGTSESKRKTFGRQRKLMKHSLDMEQIVYHGFVMMSLVQYLQLPFFLFL